MIGSRSVHPIAAIGVGVALVLTGGVGGALLVDGGPTGDTQAALERARARVTRLRAERDRLRAERTQLETRLAASDGARVCPQEYVSTGALLPRFTVDHPCGWHVLFDPTAPVSSEDRPGLRAEVLLLSQLPISLAATGGPAADLELVDWTDDPADDQDALPPLPDWVAEERERFTQTTLDDRFEVGDNLTVHRLVGQQDLFDEPTTVHLMVWRYDDPVDGTRHIVRAYAVTPGARAAAALEQLARSFRVRTS